MKKKFISYCSDVTYYSRTLEILIADDSWHINNLYTYYNKNIITLNFINENLNFLGYFIKFNIIFDDFDCNFDYIL